MWEDRHMPNSTRFALPLAAALALAACVQPRAGLEEEGPFAPPPPIAAVPGQRGLWMGPIRLCRDNVVSVERVSTDWGGPALLLTFSGDIQPRLGEVTGALVGQPLPLRVDGRPITAPNVNEPIMGTQVQTSAPNEEGMRAIEAGANAAC
jgi:hypothetical protein